MRKNALVAGAMYAGMIVSTSVWYGIAQGFMEGRDAAGMLAALQAAQSKFEFSIVLGAAGFIFWVLAGLTLSRLMRPVGEGSVVALLTFVSLGAVMGLLAVAREMDALAMLRAAGAPAARDVALAMEGFRSVFVVSMVFSALWLIPLGWLVIRCGFLPRVLGVALILGSVFYFGNFVGPAFDAGYQSTMVGKVVGVLSGVPSVIGEFGTCLSLIIFGLRRGPAAPVTISSPMDVARESSFS
jgi:hypothetical protein